MIADKFAPLRQGLQGTLRLMGKFKPGKATLIIVGSFAMVFALISTRPDKTPEPRSERAWSIEVVPAEVSRQSPTLELFGRVQSYQDADLSAAIEAVVSEMLVRDGQSVAEGELLLVLDDRDARLELAESDAELKEARAQLNFARVKLERSKQAYTKEQELLQINLDRTNRAEEIYDEGLLSRSDLDTAKENLARQQLAVNQSELSMEENKAKLIELDARIARISAVRDRAALDLERTQIKAPFAGVISDMQISEGDRVRTGDPLMRLQNPNSLEVRAQIPSRLARPILDGMQEGSAIRALVEIDGRNIPGSLARVSGQTSEGSGGVDSFIGFDEAMSGLRLGSTVRVLLELPAEPNVIAVPGEAVYGRNTIYRVSEGRMQMVAVERVGEREYSDGRTEVLVRAPSLEPTDQIIVTKLANASDGLLVDIKPTQVAAEERETTTADNQ